MPASSAQNTLFAPKENGAPTSRRLSSAITLPISINIAYTQIHWQTTVHIRNQQVRGPMRTYPPSSVAAAQARRASTTRRIARPASVTPELVAKALPTSLRVASTVSLALYLASALRPASAQEQPRTRVAENPPASTSGASTSTSTTAAPANPTDAEPAATVVVTG